MRMFLFDRQQKVKQWLVDQDFIEAKMTEEINTASKLVFSLPLNKRLPTSYFYAAIPQPQGNGYLLFKIITEQVKSDRINYTCVESAYDELKTYHYIKDVRPQNRSAADMLRQALEGTRWTSGVVSDAGTNSTNFYYISSLEAIQKIANLFQLEATFTITLDPKTNEITRRQVNLYSQQGNRTGKRFEYGSNLLKVEQEESAENLITALIGRGKGEQVSTGDENTPDGYGRRINFGDVVWSKKNGNPVDKPAGQEYVEDPDATAAYGFNDGKPRMGLQIFEDITDPTELLQATWSALQTLKRPRVSFKADVLDVGSLGLGDTVAIIRHDIKIEYFTRVYKVEHNLLNEKLNTIELGDDFNSQSITSAINSIANTAQQAGEIANHAAIAANGKNTNSYSQTQPTVGVEGDLWYKDLGNGETDMYQYRNGAWVLIQSTRDLRNIEQQVNQQVDQIKQMDTANKNRDKEIQKFISDTRKELDSAKADTTDKLNQFKITAEGLKEAIGNQDGQISQFKIDISGLKNSVSDSTGKISTIQSDLLGIKLSVASKANISYVDQKVTEWNVTVKKLEQKIPDGVNPNMLNGTADWSGDWYQDPIELVGFDPPVMKWQKDGWTDPEGNAALVQANVTDLAHFPLKQIFLPLGKYTLSAWIYTPDLTTFTDSCLDFDRPLFNNADKKATFTRITTIEAINTNQWQRVSKTIEVTKAGVVNIKVISPKSKEDPTQFHVGSLKLEKGDKATAWVPSVNDSYDGTGEMMSMINVDANRILFKSRKLYMDADSTIFSGKAFIPDAAISNLSADKITTGTLNAGLINVINLNASSITTGTINGANLKIDLNNGEVQFKRGRITSIANTLNINIDTGTMSVTDSVNNGVYFANGELKLMDDPLNITGTPKYGGLRRSVHIWSPGSAGAELHSPNGVFVGSDNYNGAFAGGSIIDGTTSGAALAVDKNGSATLNGGNIVTVSGGGAYDVGYSMKNRPAIILGKSPSGWNPGDRTFIQGSYVHIKPVYEKTGSGSPNVIVNQDGALVRSTSASKYKTDINRSYQTDYGKKLLSLPTATWVDKGQKERYQAGKRSIEPEKYFGMIAEDLADAGLDLLVTRNTEGEIEGIQYDRIAVALIPVIKELKSKIEKLEAK